MPTRGEADAARPVAGCREGVLGEVGATAKAEPFSLLRPAPR